MPKGPLVLHLKLEPKLLWARSAALTDKPETGTCAASRDGSFGRSDVSRADLAAFVAQRLKESHPERETITYSGERELLA